MFFKFVEFRYDDVKIFIFLSLLKLFLFKMNNVLKLVILLSSYISNDFLLCIFWCYSLAHKFSLLLNLHSPSVSQWLAASASPGNLSDMQILLPHSRLNESESQWVGPKHLPVTDPQVIPMPLAVEESLIYIRTARSVTRF